MFSPRTRGCSGAAAVFPIAGHVFPAHAGMFRKQKGTIMKPFGFPRARGDVPSGCEVVGWVSGFSPRTRGCSGGQEFVVWNPKSFPRARGDVPVANSSKDTLEAFSPRTRGCS